MARSHFLVALLALAAASLPAPAQEWPSRPIRFIVPYPAGGSTDVGARVIADYLARSLGQQIIVENRSGGSGNIGFEAGARSAPDGYTVLIAPDQVTSAPHVFKVSFDPLKDLAPVIQLSRQPVVLAVHPKLGVGSLAELVALAKQRPGLSYATSGVGSQQHMTAEWFAQIAGIKLEHVPYRGGAQAINDLVAGHVMIGSLGSTPLIPHYKAGALRLLAQTTAARSPSLPDVPTYAASRHQVGARSVAWRLRTRGNAARHCRATQQRDEQGACRSGDTRNLPAIGARAGRRHRGSIRTIGARRFRQVCPPRQGAQHQSKLDEAYRRGESDAGRRIWPGRRSGRSSIRSRLESISAQPTSFR